MGLLDTLQRAAGAVGGFAGDVFGQVLPTLGGALLGQILPPVPTQGTVPGGFGFPGFPSTGGFAGPLRGPERLVARPSAGALPVGAALSTGIESLFNIGGTMPVLPGGAQFQQAGLGSSLLGGVLGGLGTEALGLFGGGGGGLPALPGVAPGGIFRVTQPGLRARSLFHITNPSTGREVWYRNVGQPILFSGDLRTCKRVRKIARLAARGQRKR